MYVVLLLWSASSGSWMPRRASSGGGFDWGCGWWGLASWMNFGFKDGARLSSRQNCRQPAASPAMTSWYTMPALQAIITAVVFF